MAYSWQSDIIRPDGENGTEVLDGQGVFQPQIEGGDNITIENGKINASGTLENVQADYTETDASAPSYIKHKPDLSIYATASGMETELAGKQDVIDDLSTIRSGAEAGSTAVQPGDLAAVATTGSYTSLTNTPQNIVQDASYVHTDNNFSNADKSKLDGIAAGAEVNVQPDWDETDSSSDAYIANKPTIPAAQVNSDWAASSGVTAILNKPDLSAYATDSELADGLATKQDVISDLDTIRAGAAAGATAAQPSDLPSSDELLPSASSGDAGKILSVDANGDPEWITPSGGTTYSAGDGIDIDANNVISADVDGTTIGIDSTTKKIKSLQTIPTKTSDLQNDSNFVVASSLATVATSGSYTDLSNKPAIPTKTSDLQNDSNFVSSSSLATVATTGSYNDLSDKPVIPPGVTVDQTYNASSTNAQSGTAVAGAIAGVKQVPSSTSADENKVLTVNSSGNPVWEDSAVPASKTLVAGSNVTITENINDVTISATDTTYTAGDGIDITSGVVSADVDGTTIGIDASTKKIKLLSTIPTKTSDLTNDSNFVVASSLATVATTGAYSDLTGTPTIPSVDQSYNASSSNAQSGVAVAQAIAAIPAAPVEVVTNQNSFELKGDNPVKVEFTRVEDTSVIIHTTVDLTSGSPVDGDDNQTMVIAFDLDAVNKAVDDDGPVLKINTALPANSGLSQFQWGFNDSVSTSDNYSNYIQAGSNTSYGFPSGEIDLCNPGTIGTRSYSRTRGIESNTKRYFIVKAVFTSTYKSAISTWMSNGNITIKDWPTEGYGNKVVIPNIPASTSADASKVLTVGNDGTTSWQTPSAVTVDQHYSASSTNAQSGTAVAEALGSSSTLAAGNGVTLTESAGTLTVAADVDNVTIGFDSTTHKIKSLQTVPSVDQTYNSASTNAQSGTAVAQAISGVNAVPASTSADEDKVLTVNSSGNPVWENSAVPASKPLVAGTNITITDGANDVTIAATDTTYTAGNMMSLTNGAFGVSTTAGITDIQIVNALPASPVATVLYLIQET